AIAVGAAAGAGRGNAFAAAAGPEQQRVLVGKCAVVGARPVYAQRGAGRHAAGHVEQGRGRGGADAHAGPAAQDDGVALRGLDVGAQGH
nr:hypothetical protein [Tanacetum cinerariifolium]